MNNKISSKRLEILTKIGFSNPPDCDPTMAFHTYSLALDSKMIVRGDHASECAYIYYCNLKDNEREYDGLFYAPSLLEHPHLNSKIFSAEEILNNIKEYCYSDAEYVGIGGIPMIYIPVSDYDFDFDLKDPLSDMLKLIGMLDYFLSEAFEKNNKK